MKKNLEIQEVAVFHKRDEWLLCFFNCKLIFLIFAHCFFNTIQKCKNALSLITLLYAAFIA